MPASAQVNGGSGDPGIDPPVPATTPAPQSEWRNWLLLCGFLLGAAVFAAVLHQLRPRWAAVLFPSIGLGTLHGLTAALAASTTVIAIHEAGHLLAAVCMRFVILAVRVGPVRLTRMYGKWIVQFSFATMFTGAVSAIPPRYESAWRSKMLAVVAAGPVATLFCFLAVASALRHTQSAGWFHDWLTLATALNFFTLVVSLAPNGRGAPVRNDAQLFYAILRNTAEADDMYAYHCLTHLRMSGDRPRDYPADVISSIATSRKRPDIALLCADTIILWAVDRGDFCTADVWDRRSLELSMMCNRELQNLGIAKSACLDVVLRSDFATAKRKFAKVRFRNISPTWLRERIAAASCSSEGRVDAALSAISRARCSFPERLPYFAFEEMLLSRITELI